MIVLVATSPELCFQWEEQAERLNVKAAIKIVNLPIDQLVTDGHTVVVTPGNSAGLMGGGLDRAIRECFGESKTVQRHVSKSLKRYKPPGMPTLIKFPNRIVQGSIAQTQWKCDTLLHFPTMRTPQYIADDHHKLIFDWVWNILSMEIEQTLVIPGLGTGYGGVSYEVCARAMVGAISLFASPIDKVYQFLGEDYSSLVNSYK